MFSIESGSLFPHSPHWSRLVSVCLWTGGLLLLASGCSSEPDRLFARLDANRTGIEFANTIPQDDSIMNPLDFFYVYNGGGVAVGDLNGDDRPDLYFAGNAVANRLYLNQGDLQFREDTDAAGVAAPDVWATGVSLVDINQDGRTDIYVSVGGPSERVEGRANRLYIHQGVGPDGVPSFQERAEAYGLADAGYSTHTAFFDADRDGDLDAYVLNTAAVRGRARSGQGGRVEARSNADRFYRNDGDGTFTEVSQSVGITHDGYGLGLAVGDINKDGWPDVYAANDLHTRDRLYVNDGDGTFTDRSLDYLRHQSYSAMGVDLADVNNDAWGDLMVLDMLPKDPQRRRLVSTSGAPTDGIWQYVRNTLQLNNGRTTDGMVPFSEIGQLAGVDATGWSWAPLLADFDNDGDRDLFVSNGFGELITHLDFARRRQKLQALQGPETRSESLYEAMDELPRVHLTNRFFENKSVPRRSEQETPRFTEQTGAWASHRPGISNGATFADLDRDGDLDLVTNNINESATVLENLATNRDDTHALRVDLHGPDGNRSGLGARVTLSTDGRTQYHEHTRYRGYQSTVEGIIHFGLGADSTADSLSVVWPDGRTQRFADVQADQVLDVKYASGSDPADLAGVPSSARGDSDSTVRFEEVAARRGLGYRHRETRRGGEMPPLLPHIFSQNGPGIAVGDVDGDGLDDVFVGADRGRERQLFRQVAPGRFRKRALSMAHSYSGTHSYEDMGALFFDADGDRDQDLYVVSGSDVGPSDNSVGTYQDRLYLNEGDGRFHRAQEALPEISASGSGVTAADYDRDGDLDLFVGGRVQPGRYPMPPRSYLLRNDTDESGVEFTDVTPEIAPGLAEVGLVTDARWTDYNDDGRVDLMVVGEWMPITVFQNTGDRFVEQTEEVGLRGTSGWWNSLTAGDFDRDGDTDYVAGNLGLNTRYQASREAPVRVHAKDFDADGRLDAVLSQVVQGTRVPAHERRELVDQLGRMEDRFPSHRAYAEASFDEVLTPSERADAYTVQAVRYETSYVENQEDGTFAVRSLPLQTQTAPVFGVQTGDYTGDGRLDLLMVGNWYAPDSESGRADAFVGVFLRGKGDGSFTVESSSQTGFLVEGDAKGAAEIATGSEGVPLVLVTQNRDSLKAFAPSSRDGTPVRVRPLDRYARLTFEDGTTRKEELYGGSTYLSQSSRVLWVPPEATRVVVHGADGAVRTIK